jgi:hypothetical protein
VAHALRSFHMKLQFPCFVSRGWTWNGIEATHVKFNSGVNGWRPIDPIRAWMRGQKCGRTG